MALHAAGESEMRRRHIGDRLVQVIAAGGGHLVRLLADLCAGIVVGQLALDSWLEYSDTVQICLTDREPAPLASFLVSTCEGT